MARRGSAGHRLPAPSPDALVRWPDAFGTRFALFVDTEEEFDWRAPLSARARDVTATAALPAAHARLRAMGVRPTYLVDHPIATEPAAVDAVRAVLAAGDAAVGAQLHPWVNPPIAADEGAGYPGALPPEVEAAKLDVLTAAIERAFGHRPLAYRAGRYGLGPATLALLAARGYRVDASVRARYDYSADGGPDYTQVGAHAFRAGPGGAVMELPFTTMFTGRWRVRGSGLFPLAARLPRGPGALARARLLSRVSLTPEGMPLADALEAVRVALGEGLRLLNLSFHSPSLVPGHTPYVRDAADLAAFWRWWDGVLALLARRGVACAGLHEAIAAADASLLGGAGDGAGACSSTVRAGRS